MSEDAIRQVIESAYIQGIHLEQDEQKVRDGFHPEFRMLVPRDPEIVPIDALALLKLVVDAKAANPAAFEREFTYDIQVVDRVETMAVARVKTYRGGVHQYTDFMTLYEFAEGWKIVCKALFRHAPA